MGPGKPVALGTSSHSAQSTHLSLCLQALAVMIIAMSSTYWFAWSSRQVAFVTPSAGGSSGTNKASSASYRDQLP